MATKLDLPKREHYKFKGYYDVDGGKCYDEEGYSLNYAGERWDPTNANNKQFLFLLTSNKLHLNIVVVNYIIISKILANISLFYIYFIK